MSLLPEIERELLRAARGLPPAPEQTGDHNAEPRHATRRGLTVGGVLTASLAILAVVVAGVLLIALHSGAPRQGAGPAHPATRFSGAPHNQPGSWRQGGNLCPLAPRNRYLPRRAGCVTVRRADITGDGRPDLILLYGHLGTRRYTGGRVPIGFTLKVLRSSGATFTAQIAHPEQAPTIVSVHNVNSRSGDEIFVQQASISSGSSVDVYTFDGRRLRRAGPAFTYGGDSALRYGFDCHRGHPATIVQHAFVLLGGKENGRWQRTDTTYRWDGATLKRTTKRTTQTHGYPAKRLTGPDC